MPFSEVLRALENAGEVCTSLAEHNAEKKDTGITFQARHEVCFVLDPLGKKRKKARVQSVLLIFSY